MAMSIVCPTEEAVQALLEYLVCPMLPAKSSMKETPSLPQQQSVARQVHAVVLLYNYYHRKQHTRLEYLGFDAFCKLAVILKPSLLAHMKFMQGSDDTELDDLEKQLSLTEKAIIEACDIASSLDPSKDVPAIEEWPIHKVTVLLVDYKKENCLLLFSSITEGTWSVIAKDLDVVNPCPEVTEAEKHANKKKRIIKKHLKKLSNVDEGTARQIAYSAVKEVTGFNQTDLVILERHVVYSLSNEKSAALFYITQCTQKNSEGIFQVSIKDAINSLKGPLITKLGSKWTVTEVVEYFHLLPHAQKLSDWFQRNDSSVSVQIETVGEDVTPILSGYCQKAEITKCPNEICLNGSMVDGHSPETRNGNIELQKLKQNDGSSAIHSSEFIYRIQGTNVDDPSNALFDAGGKGTSTSNAFQVDNQLNRMNPILKGDSVGSASGLKGTNVDDPSNALFDAGGKGTSTSNAFQVDNQLNRMNSILKGDSVGSASGLKDKMVTRKGGDDEFTAGKICEDISADQNEIHDGACVTYQLTSKCFEKLQMTIASKEKILSQTALRALTRKRDKLSLKQRLIQDEIAQCNKNIQIISHGGEDDLAIKIDSIIECCNDLCETAEERNNEYPEALRRTRMSEATLIMENPCLDLDRICNQNNWILPTYLVNATGGGFQANVIIKGVDFEFLGRGDPHSSPGEARDSAAKKILNQFRSLNYSA